MTFAPGDTSETVTVKVNGDNVDEADETFDVDLTNNSANSSIDDGQGVGTIQNDDGDPGDLDRRRLRHRGQRRPEGLRLHGLAVQRRPTSTITVDWATADDTATDADGDYDADSGT